MITKLDIIADLHTHTIASKHAYSTVKENIEEARNNGIKYLAITDHYLNDGTDIEKKNETARIIYAERINYHEKDIRIIAGAEFNLNQSLYEPRKILKLRWRPVGLHNWFVNTKNLTLEDVFELFKEASKNHNAFVHIERELHKINNGKHGELDDEIKELLKKIVLFAKENNILLEVNESSLITNENGGAKRLEYWLNIAKKNGNLIYLGTDAHYYKEIGKFDNAISLLNKINYPKELILNCNEKLLKEKLNFT